VAAILRPLISNISGDDSGSLIGATLSLYEQEAMGTTKINKIRPSLVMPAFTRLG
jgi:hypothetical protein